MAGYLQGFNKYKIILIEPVAIIFEKSDKIK